MSKHNKFNTFNQQSSPKKSFLKNPLGFMDGLGTDAKIIGGIGMLTLILLIGGVWFMSSRDAKEQEKLNKPLLGREIKVQGSNHIKPGESHADYNSNPPTSGPMYDDVSGPGFHDSEVPDEKAVHSMEHGAAIVWYKADLPKNKVEKITKAFQNASGKSVMLPRKNLDTPIALTSWGRLLALKTIDAATIKEFIETNNDRAPEKSSMY